MVCQLYILVEIRLHFEEDHNVQFLCLEVLQNKMDLVVVVALDISLRWKKYNNAKGLEADMGVWQLIRKLKCRISEHLDKQVVLLENLFELVVVLVLSCSLMVMKKIETEHY